LIPSTQPFVLSLTSGAILAAAARFTLVNGARVPARSVSHAALAIATRVLPGAAAVCIILAMAAHVSPGSIARIVPAIAAHISPGAVARIVPGSFPNLFPCPVLNLFPGSIPILFPCPVPGLFPEPVSRLFPGPVMKRFMGPDGILKSILDFYFIALLHFLGGDFHGDIIQVAGFGQAGGNGYHPCAQQDDRKNTFFHNNTSMIK
jgi:hypothetical protein